MIDPVTGAGLAQLLEEGIWYAFGAGALFGAFVIGPFLALCWEMWQDHQEEKRGLQWSRS